MRRSLWAILFSVALLSSGMFADTIITLVPNDSTGDNFAFLQSLNGTEISIEGGTPYSFFNTNAYAPGSVLAGPVSVFFSDNNTVTINGTQYELDFANTGTLFMSSITLPTNGQSFFMAKVVLGFTAPGIYFVGGIEKLLNIRAVQSGEIPFVFENGAYYAAGGFTAVPTAVPEPSAIGLMGSGLIGMLGLARKRFRV
jgi:hypothetical protein